MTKAKARNPLFSTPISRLDHEHGHLYETPDGNFFGATTFIGVIDKPVLKFWYASQQTAYVTEAAGDLWEDAPIVKRKADKMTRTAFILSLKKRIGTVKKAHKETERAQEIGTQAHALVEWALRTELGQKCARPEARIEAEYAFQSFENWRASVNLEPLYIEQIVWSKTFGYAGTVDLIAYLDLKDERHDYGRTLAIIDWKTGKRHYPESSLQSAAYAWAYHEMGHADAPPPGLVVRLPKIKTDPGFDTKLVHSADFEEDFAAFLQAKGVWTWLRKAEEKAAKIEAAKKAAKVVAAPELEAVASTSEVPF